ncbi:MAG TPA: hypothetical protein VGP56_06945 [Gaiellaceae bacterium]|jgi:hypothetical protein|nr:hypothetical protein [Gaiellaceae bacterium]
MRRWVPPLLALTALLLVPWTIFLATTLPSHEVAEHWDLAWAGFDLMLAAALLSTAVSAWRGGPLLQANASAAGTLLVVDAWFDLLTSSGRNLTYAIVLAVVAELPLALICLWIVRDSKSFTRRLAVWRTASSPGSPDTAAISPGGGPATPTQSSSRR